ncbi:hypothetical protein HDU67_004779, partial [Dinochytrium kinnereticum]
LESAGETVPEETRCSYLLASLPASYDIMVSTLENDETNGMNYGFVVKKLLDQ